MILPELNLELTMSQEFKLVELQQELSQPNLSVSTTTLADIIISLTRQLMIQKNVTGSLIKAIAAVDATD